MKAVLLSSSPNKEIHEQIGTNKNNTFGSSGGNKNEKEKASKGQEGREKTTKTGGAVETKQRVENMC